MADDPAMVNAKAYPCAEPLTPETAKRALMRDNPGSVVQATRREAAKNGFFVEMIAAQTFQARRSGTLLAKKPEIDLLLRLAGTTQIAAAIEEVGAKDGGSFLAIVASSYRTKRPPEFAEPALPRHPLSHEELDRIERAALLRSRRV